MWLDVPFNPTKGTDGDKFIVRHMLLIFGFTNFIGVTLCIVGVMENKVGL